MFYLVVPRSPELETLDYRLVVDGVWLPDPNAPDRYTDSFGVAISRIPLPEQPPYRTPSPQTTSSGRTTFYFTFDLRVAPTLETVDNRQLAGASFSDPDIALVGSFNNWNPFTHRLRPDPERPGFYRISVSLPPGTHYYYFIVDGERVLDPFNRERAIDRRTGATVALHRVP